MSTLLNKANAIKTEKDTYLKPRNIKVGVEVFGTTGIFNGDAPVNVFTQITEPANKNGIWLKSNSISSPTLIEDESVFGSEEWNTDKMSELALMPITVGYYEATSVGTNIYVFNTSSTYKYDTLLNVWTQLANPPYSFTSGAVCSVGNDIYMFGGQMSNEKKAYKYDTINNTWTRLTDIPYKFHVSPVVNIGTDIYLLGSQDSSCYKYNYKYDTLTGTYTQLNNIPQEFYRGSAVAVGTDIYIFGTDYGGTSSESHRRAFKYNTLTNTWTQLASCSYQLQGNSAVAVGTDIYLFGSAWYTSSSYAYAHYLSKYNTLTDTYTRLTDIPYGFMTRPAVKVNNDIYLVGGFDTGYGYNMQLFILVPKTYQNNSIVIANNKANAYQTELISTNVAPNGLKYHFNNFWYATTESDVTTFDTTTPAYYGNGIEWLGLRNPAVLSVELNKSSTIIAVGGTETLTATVKPTNATTKTVTWSSSDDAIATVDSSGEITGVASGTATITVTTTDGGFTDTCTVSVIPDLEVHIS